ncbi:hypothetical protein EJ04DRAFT_594865 [Polyplosphaeria fusca]|uniref:Uncharacterized protein n=1 Tax=Polyplosphaeria fusca TaxID=682080 RepID=A0A9P4QMA5_9PLEO|nr:hypothetical protein EJ04DRAFT_594865 [Polyplosphaeria fusca]
MQLGRQTLFAYVFNDSMFLLPSLLRLSYSSFNIVASPRPRRRLGRCLVTRSKRWYCNGFQVIILERTSKELGFETVTQFNRLFAVTLGLASSCVLYFNVELSEAWPSNPVAMCALKSMEFPDAVGAEQNRLSILCGRMTAGGGGPQCSFLELGQMVLDGALSLPTVTVATPAFTKAFTIPARTIPARSLVTSTPTQGFFSTAGRTTKIPATPSALSLNTLCPLFPPSPFNTCIWLLAHSKLLASAFCVFSTDLLHLPASQAAL